MSWYFKSTGFKAAVRLELQNNGNIPDALKNHAIEIIDEAESYDKRDSVTVEGSGHFGGGSSGAVQSFSVVKFNQAQMPDVPAASGG